MEDNKYYTPTIDEFRVGFEYEYRPRIRGGLLSVANNEFKYFNNWVKETIGKESFELIDLLKSYGNPRSVDDVLSYSKDGAIRVKRLDRDDIEECGFEYDKYYNRYLKDSIISVTLINGIVHIKDMSWEDDDTVDDTLFIGTIKNKSELQMILKMIGV